MNSTPRIPPLNALRAFETTARLATLAAAAAELGVTPSAISHQIRTLEEALGVQLFHRTNRRLSLTKDGQTLQPGLSDAFRRIASTVSALQSNKRQGVLTVSMLETLAMHWFMPRLALFHAAHPEIEVRISTTTRTVDFDHEDIDLAIRHGSGYWPELSSDLLFPLETIPVCSPTLPTEEAPLNVPTDLSRHVLLHSGTRPNEWRDWLASVGEPELQPSRSLIFEKTNFALAAAIKGVGIAISDRHVVTEDLLSGRLISPFPQTLNHGTGYYLVYPPTRSSYHKIQIFRNWLLSESASV